jgi:hypothetical protein
LSDNSTNTGYAAKGNTLTLQVTADENLQGMTGTIAGQSVAFTAIDLNTTRWSAAYTIPTDDTLDSLDGQTAPFTSR